MTVATFSVFILSSGLLLFMPGPTNALLMSSGALSGFRRSLPLIAVEIAGYLAVIAPLLALDALASGFRMELSLILKSLAASVMIVAAARLWLGAGSGAADAAGPGATSIFLITLFNPKSLIFAFAILPPVAGLADLAVKGAMLTGLVVLSALFWIAIGAGSRRLPVLPGRWVARASSLVLTGFAVYFVASVIGAVAA